MLPKRIITETQRLPKDLRMCLLILQLRVQIDVTNTFFYLLEIFSVCARISLLAPGITAVPKEDNLRYFSVTIAGPPSTPYAGTSEIRTWSWVLFSVFLFVFISFCLFSNFQ
jgi:hypothetical protein